MLSELYDRQSMPRICSLLQVLMAADQPFGATPRIGSYRREPKAAEHDAQGLAPFSEKSLISRSETKLENSPQSRNALLRRDIPIFGDDMHSGAAGLDSRCHLRAEATEDAYMAPPMAILCIA